MESAGSYPLWSYQPFRLSYNVYDTLFLTARLPYWIATSAVPSLRPVSQWSFKQTIMSRILRAAFHKMAVIGITETHTLDAGKEGERFEVVQPFPDTDYLGPVAPVAQAKPGAVGGTWYPERFADIKSKTVMLHIHGGAFIWGDGRTACSGFLAQIMQDQAETDAVFSIQYRLSAYEGKNPFPAALQDALTGYLYLVRTLQIPPANIVILGDSSGATIASGLIRYLGEYGSKISPEASILPSCAILTSPMIAPLKTAGSGSLNESPYAQHPNFHTDFVPLSTLRWGWCVYAGNTTTVEAAAQNPYFTPLGHPFATKVPIFISIGRREIFLPDNEEWAAQMQEIPGNSIDFTYEDDALHETLLLGNVLGFEESAKTVAKRIGVFIKKHSEKAEST
ncbi:alpha/beta hydrolase fold-3 domain-containing protein [Stachybotrys elegans]|uniref:Alpha/beta hydrolase fold-3 domain-containing protein n=1 Tax=Stachybotrys elegans TaxID=80388 RepID=A0A8K0SWS8_9HYPO|nr:alpha/beta hydrolase fold-3 domain-containing protein [Stachybotrys elegans]